MNDIIKIIISLEDSDISIARFTETLKHEIETRRWSYWGFASTFSRIISTPSNFLSINRNKWKRF